MLGEGHGEGAARVEQAALAALDAAFAGNGPPRAHHRAFHHALDQDVVRLDFEAGLDVGMDGHVAHEEDVAGVEVHVAAHVEHLLHRDQPVVVEDVSVGVGHHPAGRVGIEFAVGAAGQFGGRGVVHVARVQRAFARFLQRHQFRQHLPFHHVLNVAEIVAVDVAGIVRLRLQVHVVEIGLEMVAQVVWHVALSVGCACGAAWRAAYPDCGRGKTVFPPGPCCKFFVPGGTNPAAGPAGLPRRQEWGRTR
ncbi:hypothetical protein DSECCO2_656250 [anaerobic digester metagenome]